MLQLRGDGLISARTAAQLWGMLDTTQLLRDGDPIDVLVVGRSARIDHGVRIHRTRTLARQDIRWRNGIPVTSPARTLLGCAAVFDEPELEALLAAALRKNLMRASELREVIARNPRASGIATLRALAERPGGARDTRSVYERKLLRLLRDADLPLELDGWQHHGGREQFEHDRLRDQRLAVAGQRVIRVTGRQIDHRPYALVARMASLITVRGLAGAGGPGGGPLATAR
ncbi:MAG: hypothetical protein M0T77_15435 [Actinomycetota bacterium]|nr:hypothetical protein [Actinomycetota bacterium]